MYAIVKTGGKQYRVAEGDVIDVERLAVEPGEPVTLAAVLLVDGEGDNTTVITDADRLAAVSVTGEGGGHGKGPKIHPKPLATGAVNEATEGLLVRVVATITQAPVSDLPYGFKFFVDDGSGELTIFVNTQTDIDLTDLAAGQRVSVTGFSSQFDTHYEIDPRFQADITRQHR